jgi:hypothetical protein
LISKGLEFKYCFLKDLWVRFRFLHRFWCRAAGKKRWAERDAGHASQRPCAAHQSSEGDFNQFCYLVDPEKPTKPA